MSTSIDQRVVEMRFDNKQFEQNVSTTMSTLDKLRQGLNLKGATQGLENVDAAAKKVNLSGLGSAVETVGLKFNALYSIADQALRNITNSAMQSAKKIASSFTIDPIKTGFSEYETQINAVQTILANTESKGTTLQDVNRALDELNTYADKTIYNFTEMTRNIGTFTAAGVDLDTSVNAIQGIANLAAVSGSNAQQASTAMYQLSQALSSGTVKLMDWNSVVNAGMGGQVFQDALKATARNHGVAIDDMIEKQGSFRETLQEGWLTADILTETLSHFTMAAQEGTAEWDAYKKSLMESGYTEQQAEEIIKLSTTATDAATKVKTFTQLMDTLKEAAQSGWTQSWEIIVGDFEEAKNFLTDVSDRLGSMIGAASEARVEMLSGGLSSGWKQLLNEGIADEEGFKETFKNVAKEQGVAIDDMIAKQKEMDSSLSDTEAFQKALSTGLLKGKITSDMFTESVHNMASKMSKMSEEELKAAGYTVQHVEDIKKLSKGLADGSISMDEFTKKMLRPSGRENIIEALWNAFDGLMSVIVPVKEAMSEIFPPITGEQLYSFTQTLKEFTSRLTLSETASNKLKRTFRGLFAAIDIVKEVFIATFKAISPLFGKMGDLSGGLLDTTARWGDWIVNLRDSIKEGNVFGKVVDKIHIALDKVFSFLSKIADGVKDFGKAISESFSTITNTAKKRFEPLTILGNIIKGIFSGLGAMIRKFAPAISAFTTAIGEMFSGLGSALQNGGFDKFFDLLNSGIFAAIGIGIARFINSGVGFADGAKGILESVSGMFEGIGESINAFTGSIKANTLKKIAVSIGILAASLLVLSLIPSEKLTNAIGAITVLFAELMASLDLVTKLTSGSKLRGLTTTTSAMMSIASSLLILSVALKIMSTMSWEEMGVGLISLTVGLGALVGAVNLLPEHNMKKAAKSIKKLASALVILALAIKIMSTMSWEEMGVGLISMVVGLGALVGAVNLLPKDTAIRAAGMIGLATAMVILGAALKIMATMSWEEIAKGLSALGGSIVILVAALNLMKRAIPGALAMLIITPALLGLGAALKIMSSMSWDEVARGLVAFGGAMIILTAAMNLMKRAIPGAVAMLIITPALLGLAAALKITGSMSWGEVARGLVVLAGAFTVIGLAALILKPLIPTIFYLAAAVVMLGVACAAIGVGVMAIGTGLASIAAAGAAAGSAIVVIVSGLIGLIPYLIEQIGIGIVNLLGVISGAGDAICEAVTVIILAAVKALVASVPAIDEGVFVLIDSLLTTLVDYTPVIVGKLFDFLIGILETVAQRLPELIQAGVDIVMAFFSGVISALQSIDPSVLINGLLAVGLLTAMMTALAAMALLAPAAMIGVLAMGVVIAELAIVLAAIGALAQIPGLKWLVSEGGAFMQAIGTAIGQFIGGIVGGIAQGISSSLPQIGSDLSTFMSNIQPFVDGAKSIDDSVIDGVTNLATAMLTLTGANLLDSLTSWLTGGSSLADFGAEIAAFGPSIKAYADSVAGIDTAEVSASAEAVNALANMAANLPNSGGVLGFFSGENDIGMFGEQLKPFGEGLKAYADSVIGIDTAAVVNSVEAAKAIVDMSNNIPNEGGVAAFFAGDNSISKFGDDLIALGDGLKGFSDSAAGIVPENITTAAEAAKAITDMASTIPNEGGVKAWFGGDNSIANFATGLVALGIGLQKFATSTAGIVPENITAAANAAKSLADMANVIPNEGGIKAWFSGDNSLAKFAYQLPTLGAGLLLFSTSVAGIVPDNIVAAANAAKSIAEMANIIPNQGGIESWFSGDNGIARFAYQLPTLGAGLLSFSTSVAGIVPENITAAVSAAKSLADMANIIPNQGGIESWISGDNSIASFALQLPLLGKGLLAFSTSSAGIVPENITAAVSAAKSLAEMANIIPNQGGIESWFSGDNSIASFAFQLPILGAGLLSLSTSVAGIVPENITAAANAAKSLAEMANVIPNQGGIESWFSGDNSVAKFAKQLPGLGEGLKGFSDSVAGITPENVTAAASAAKSIADMSSSMPEDITNMVSFGQNIAPFGDKLKTYFSKISEIGEESIAASTNAITSIKDAATGLEPGKFTEASSAIDEVVNAISKLSKIKASDANGFSNAVKKIAETNVSSMVTAFKNVGSDMSNAGKELITKFISGVEGENAKITNVGKTSIDKFIEGIKSKKASAESASKTIATSCATAISGMSSNFKQLGRDFGTGLIIGIKEKYVETYWAAYELGRQAYLGEMAGQQSGSPSKLTIQAGKWFGEGLIIGIDKMSNSVYNAGYDLGDTAVSSISTTISKISDAINTDIDSQPTIRPVLDLTNVRSGADSINSMFSGSTSVGLMANVNSISSSMNRRSQNGVNGDVVSAIDKLSRKMDNINNASYTINGVTYDDGSNVASAIETIVRAAVRERRI